MPSCVSYTSYFIINQDRANKSHNALNAVDWKFEFQENSLAFHCEINFEKSRIIGQIEVCLPRGYSLLRIAPGIGRGEPI